jgi:23S rRNA (adenine-N6)-dimethyltransferase
VSEGPAFWGWHQLDSSWARRLVDSAGIEPGDLVVDIGAGTGAITRALVAAGAKVIAVELHPRRAAQLRREFSGQAVIVVQADAADLRLPRRPFQVVANPPFAVTTAIVRRLTHAGSRLERADLVLPSWAAMRWMAGRGLGGIGAKQGFTLAPGQRIPTHAFRPASPGPARVLRITRRGP